MTATAHAPTFTPCGAKTRKGGTCQQPAMPNGRCRLHGGMSLAGVASPTFKHGRRSKYMPVRLVEHYKEGLSDPELLNLQDEIALIDARLNDVLGRVDTGEAGAIWRRVREAYLDFNIATHDQNVIEARRAMDEIGRLTEQGVDDYAAWHEAQALIDQRRKLVEAEQKRRVAMQQMITAQEALVFAAAILDTVKRNVSDTATLSAIQADVNRLIAQNVR